MTVFTAEGTARTFNYQAGDVGYVPFAQGHYIQNVGNETVWYLEIFKSSRFEDMSLEQWMALLPKELLSSNLNIGPDVFQMLHKNKTPVVKHANRKDEFN